MNARPLATSMLLGIVENTWGNTIIAKIIPDTKPSVCEGIRRKGLSVSELLFPPSQAFYCKHVKAMKEICFSIAFSVYSICSLLLKITNSLPRIFVLSSCLTI